MAQLHGSRLRELEMEKKHSEEMARVREEQLRMLSSVMLMQNGTMTKEESINVLKQLSEVPLPKPVA